MPVAPKPQIALPPEWRAILENVESAVDKVLADVNQREQMIEARPEAPAAMDLSQRLEVSRARLMGLDDLAEKASAVVRQADAVLAEGENLLRQGVERARHANRTLAEVAIPAYDKVS